MQRFTDATENCEVLVSLPACTAARFGAVQPFRAADVFATSDPPDTQLGSGGGTAHLLVEAWKASGVARFDTWIAGARKLLIHGSGESRRLPAYAPLGKLLLPIPPLHQVPGQRPDQCLLDLQVRTYQRLLWHAPSSYRVMITAGDVLVRYSPWTPPYPEADVLILGLSASPEEAGRHGVMVCPADQPGAMSHFLQKPSLETLRTITENNVYYLDTGIWLLSAKALLALCLKCGWDPAAQSFRGPTADLYDLYSTFGPALGSQPAQPDPDLADLTCAVLPLPDGRFYHFGTNRSVLASVAQLQSPPSAQRSFGHASMESQPHVFVQNADVLTTLSAENRHIWIENATVPPTWKLTQRHVITGVPDNAQEVALEPGICLDFVPLQPDGACIRFYGFDDAFRGAIQDRRTMWLSRPAHEWFTAHGVQPAEAGLAGDTDIQCAALFPVLDIRRALPGFLNWLVSSDPVDDPAFRAAWLRAPRRSARELLRLADTPTLSRQRRRHMARLAGEPDTAAWAATCAERDLAAAASLYAAEGWNPPPATLLSPGSGLPLVHDRMFRSALAGGQDPSGAKGYEQDAFRELRNLLVEQMTLSPVRPARNVQEDQIVWGRSPVRLDLAGGWTDTPPYCHEYGGRVLNVAVDLNGQPPIQVFARISREPGLVVRSIDLGVSKRFMNYAELDTAEALGSEFGIARAAFALCGLHPRFHTSGGGRSLEEQLRRELGGGIELSMLAAVPKGSGLGTSSILAATILATLSELCGLHWSTTDLFKRTLALEQMLTSGGGWQDQAGGMTGGLKLIETAPGLSQTPTFRWVPDRLLSGDFANRQVLLYYTGITRVAHDILGEIVRGLFLNSGEHLNILEAIGQNALFATDAAQRNDWNDLCEAIRRSWTLNQRLDRGTNPPAVQAILARAGNDLAAAKLLGAGGGGYLLMFARSLDAAQRIRNLFTREPPNERARFVDLGVSQKGLQVTRS